MKLSNSAEPEKSGSHNSVAADNETATNRVGEVDCVCEVENCPHHAQGNDLVAERHNATNSVANPQESPTATSLREQIADIVDRHTGEWKAGHNHLIVEQIEAAVTTYIEAAEINGAITQLVNYRMILRNTEKLIPTDHEYGHGKRDGQIQIAEELGEIIADLQAQKAVLEGSNGTL